jgi:predicted P-loop ATPase
VRQYLETIEADQSLEPADLNTIARDYLGAENDTAAAMLRATLIGAVARV